MTRLIRMNKTEITALGGTPSQQKGRQCAWSPWRQRKCVKM